MMIELRHLPYFVPGFTHIALSLSQRELTLPHLRAAAADGVVASNDGLRESHRVLGAVFRPRSSSCG